MRLSNKSVQRHPYLGVSLSSDWWNLHVNKIAKRGILPL